MAITEIALLHLSPTITIANPSLRSGLATAKTVMETYTNRHFYYLQQIEDPSYIYIIGEWDSLDQHMNHFIPSPENQSLLESIKDLATVEWLQHIDVPHSELPFLENTSEKVVDPEEVVYSIGRHFIKPGQKSQFQETFDANKHYVQDYATEGPIGGGWRVDKEQDKEEFVLFAPWKSVEQHYGFKEADPQGAEKYFRIAEALEGFEVRHGRIVHFE